MFQPGQQVTVIDGGWTGTIERINAEDQFAYIRFPGRPDLPAYAFEALMLTPGMFDMLTEDERLSLRLKLSDWAGRFAQTGHVLAKVALAHDEYTGQMWTRREPYVDTMHELHELGAELAAL